MKKPAIPADEESRLEALRALDILDTPADERFDRLTRLAQRMFEVQIALVSLVDENRQWFKSCVGLGASETPRDVSFCGHAILEDGVFIIPDASQDVRFADNPLVTDDPNIRFYAGCPIRAVDGSKIGTLCIIDSKPRVMDEDDIVSMQDLASMVERELAALQLATVDVLTDVRNRQGFMMLAEHSLSVFEREGIEASLVFFDLDNFKPINDNFGHAEGDAALIAFAGQMKSVFRDSDIFARLGGDEFVVLLTNTAGNQAEEIIARFQRSLDEYNRQANCGYEITFSYGIVEFHPERHQTIEALLVEGDSLMYKCKKASRIPDRLKKLAG